jgi:serine/threonine-protein kinase
LVLGIAAVVVLVGAVVFFLSQYKGSSRSSASTSAVATEPTLSIAQLPTTGSAPARTNLAPQPFTPAPQQTSWPAVIVGTCDEGGTCGVKQRDAPFTNAPRLYPDDLKDDMTVIVACQTTGDVRASAGHGQSSVWYRLANGAYVNAVYIELDGSGIPLC